MPMSDDDSGGVMGDGSGTPDGGGWDLLAGAHHSGRGVNFQSIQADWSDPNAVVAEVAEQEEESRFNAWWDSLLGIE